MRGRKPKPTAEKKLSGTARPDRELGQEPQAAAGLPEPPACLDEGAIAEWHRVAQELFAMGTLAKIDRALLAAYCSTWSRWQSAEVELQKLGPVVRGASGGACINPYFSISQRCLQELRPLCAELGLSATSRARLRVVPDKKEDDDDLAEFDSIIGFHAKGSKIIQRNRHRGTT